MKVIDLNLLLYAVNRDSVHHERAAAWWAETLSGDDTVGLAWVVVLGFLRISTRSGVFPHPLELSQALEVVDGWLQHPSVVMLYPGERHWSILRELLEKAGTGGNLTTDAHLAALAIENRAELCSTDNDFSRFRPRLRSRNPLLEGA